VLRPSVSSLRSLREAWASGELPDPVARWRRLAAEARQIADQMTVLEARLIMLSIAQGSEHLAQRAEDCEAKRSRQCQMS
jgi:hypothetical protein